MTGRVALDGWMKRGETLACRDEANDTVGDTTEIPLRLGGGNGFSCELNCVASSGKVEYA